MNTKIAQAQSLNLLNSQSFNQESVNQRITQSTNQPIKKASATSGKKSGKEIQVSPIAGRMAEKPKTQTTRGGGLLDSASGINRQP
jgi:hypothetical protein